MKPFNLKEALEGKPVITRDGREVTQITYFKDVKETCCIMAVIDNGIHSFTIDGSHYRTYSCIMDLFMAPIKTKYWVYVYNYRLDQRAMFTTVPTLLSFESFKEKHLDYIARIIKTFEFEIDE